MCKDMNQTNLTKIVETKCIENLSIYRITQIDNEMGALDRDGSIPVMKEIFKAGVRAMSPTVRSASDTETEAKDEKLPDTLETASRHFETIMKLMER